MPHNYWCACPHGHNVVTIGFVRYSDLARFRLLLHGRMATIHPQKCSVCVLAEAEGKLTAVRPAARVASR